jgi:hypothetical protein
MTMVPFVCEKIVPIMNDEGTRPTKPNQQTKGKQASKQAAEILFFLSYIYIYIASKMDMPT